MIALCLYKLYLGGKEMKCKKMMVAALLTIALSGCGSSGKTAPKEKVFIDESQISDLYTTPKKFKDKYVTLTGEIFSTPEVDDGIIAFQMWQDPVKIENNTVVAVRKTGNEDLASGDYVRITGYVNGEYRGENMLGGVVIAPSIVAEEIEKIDYITAVSPTLKEVAVNQTYSSNVSGVTISIEKVQFAKDETRLYMTVSNQSNESYHFYSFNQKIVQNGTQYEESSNYNADYPEINSEILPSVTSSGIITFKAMNQSSFKLVGEGSSNNYSIDRDHFTFEVTVD